MSASGENDFGQLMSMARGFQASKMLMVAVDLRVFDFLEEPRSAVEVAAYIKADARATGIFLNGLAALGLVVKGVDYFHNGEAASQYLVHGKDNYRGAIFSHIHHTMRGWSDLGATIAGGHPPEIDPEKWVDARPERDEAEVGDFIWGMHALARDLAPQAAAKLDLASAGHLLDLGGGPGTYAITFAQVNPALRATVFDLPGPIKIAQENIARHGLSHRIDTLAGNFLKDEIGRGYDFIWISHILHSHNENQCHLILKKAIQALTPGGTLAVQDFFLNDDGCTPPGAAMFSVHMLAVTPRGRGYYHSEVALWLEEAGLSPPLRLQSSPDAGILVAQRK
jgi:ubiquinone/menaquinone biosynthesis C-methylase UbiE